VPGLKDLNLKIISCIGLMRLVTALCVAALALAMLIHVALAQGIVVVVLNLLNGQYWGVPHIYQGVIYGGGNVGFLTNQWPKYYNPLVAGQYWLLSNTSSSQPVLELTMNVNSTGVMFWEGYYNGGAFSITLTGTYTNGSSYPADGFMVYLFLQPTSWSISPGFNHSPIPYVTNGMYYPSRVSGTLMFPQSTGEYIVVQWDPYWQFGYNTSGATGQWNVILVSNPSGSNPSYYPHPSPNVGPPYAGWDGIGTGAFKPKPGSLILMTITYNPQVNVLSGVVVDLSNISEVSSFSINLNGYFTPPSSGNYVFGVGAATGGAYANWALLYVDMSSAPQPATILTVTETTTTTVTSVVTSTTVYPTTTVTTTIPLTVTVTTTMPLTTTITTTATSIVATQGMVTIITTKTVSGPLPSLLQTNVILLTTAVILLAVVALTLRRVV